MLNDIGFTGFEEQLDTLKAFIPISTFGEKLFNRVVEITGVTALRSEVKEENWNARWESGFKPVMVNNPETGMPFVYLRAEFHPPAGNVPFELIITPKMSFGTGHHPTTTLMIQQMSKLDFHGKTVLDFGTGTGVLSILAEKLGAAAVTAIDNDDWSILNAQENICANNCRTITLAKTDKPIVKADIILANINRNVVIHNLSHIRNVYNDGGIMVCSGVLISDLKSMIAEFNRYNIRILNYMQQGEWISFVATMNN